LSYGSAIVLPKTESTAFGLLGLSHQIAIAYCLLIFLVILAFDIGDVAWAPLGLLGAWKWAIPVGVLLTASIRIQESWLTRTKKFGLMSSSLLAGNTTSGGVRIATGALHGTSVSGLIIGDVFGQLARLLVQRKTCKLAVSATFESQSWHLSKSLAKRYSDFPLLNAPAGLVFALGNNLPVLLFGTMFGPAIAGFYAMANRVSRVPMTIVAMSMRGVFLQKAAEIVNGNRSLLKAFLLSGATLAAIGIPPFAVIFLFGRQILVWLLGADWLEAGKYLEVMAPWLFAVWVSVPCYPTFVVLRKQKFWLALTTTLTSFRLGAFGVAYAMDSTPIETLQLFVIATIAGNAIIIATAVLLIQTTKIDTVR
jgi:O-antigen/teichoic acid export membrane protein